MRGKKSFQRKLKVRKKKVSLSKITSIRKLQRELFLQLQALENTRN